MQAFAMPLLAQVRSELSIVVIVLGVLAAFLFFCTAYLVFVPVAQWRVALERSNLEKEELSSRLASQAVVSEQRLTFEQRQSAEQLQRQQRAAAAESERQERRIEQLKQALRALPELRPMRAKVRDAELERHVARRLQRRLEDQIRDTDDALAALLTEVRQRRLAADAERRRARSELQAAKLALHVRGRLHDRLLTQWKEASAADRQAILRQQRLLRDAALQSHVQRRLQARLETELSSHRAALCEARQEAEQSSQQAQQVRRELRERSVSLLQARLAAMERESQLLEGYEQRLKNGDLSSQDFLDLLSGTAPDA